MWRNQLFVLDMSSDVLNADTSIRRDVGCKTVANMIKGKSPEEIRKLFNIVNDFTPEEEVRLHNRHHYSANQLTHSDLQPIGSNQKGERMGGRSMNDSKPDGSFILVIEFLFCSPLHSFVHDPCCPSTPPARLPDNSHLSRTSTHLLGTPTCLLVILRYSAAAPNKYSITNCETLPRRRGVLSDRSKAAYLDSSASAARHTFCKW